RPRRAARGSYRTAILAVRPRRRFPTAPGRGPATGGWPRRRRSTTALRQAPAGGGSLPDAFNPDVAAGKHRLDAVRSREVPGAYCDEHGPGLLEPALDPVCPVRVALGQKPVAQLRIVELGVEQLGKRLGVALDPFGDHRVERRLG